MIAAILNFCVWFLVWAGLSWPVTAREAVIGAVVSACVTYMTVDLVKGSGGRRIITLPARVFWFVVYVAVFLWECLRANIDVAYRVLHPTLPIRPGTLRVKTGLRSGVGLTFLANSITLTPGTTTVDVDKEKGCLYVHWLFVREGAGANGSSAVIARFERLAKRIFE